MRKALNCVCVAVLIILFGHPRAALAESVTKSDLAGKNICWRDGRTTFGQDGSIDSTRFAHGTWSLTGDQLVVRGTNGGFIATITKRKGTFHAVGYVVGQGLAGQGETPFGTWGKYCK
jgi:hypothetical protein